MTEPPDQCDSPLPGKNISSNCIECHYSLIGLGPSGSCPECGRPFGNELTLVGFQTQQSSAATEIVLASLLLLIGLVGSIGPGLFSCCGLPFLGAAIALAVTAYRKHSAHSAIGGDLRWVVDIDGIRSIRFQSSQIKPLTWGKINNVYIRSSYGFRARRWRSLRTRRTFLSFDLGWTRAQQIWFNNVTIADMNELRKRVLKLKTKGLEDHASERIGP